MAIDLNELMEKFLETVGTLADKGAVVARDIGARSTNLAKKTKLTAEIAAQKAGLGKIYEDLGRAYFGKYGEDYDTDFTETVMKIKSAVASIDAKTAELETLRAAKSEDDVEVEIVFDEAETEAEPETEKACEEEENKVNNFGEKAAEIKDAAVQKAGEIKDFAVQKFGEAKTATKELIDKVNANEKVQEVKTATKEFVGKVVETVGKKADEVVTAIKGCKTEAENDVEEVEEVVEEVAEEVKDTAEEIKEETEE